MAKITAYIPEPKQEYDVENQRQILQSVDTIKNELNFSYQKDLKEEQDTYNYFFILMTIQYKNETFDLTTTNITTVLTIPTSAVGIVKTIQAVHDSASSIDTDLFIRKNGAGADVQIGHESLNKETVNMLKNTLNLEAGDAIKMQAATANEITGVVSYALIDRSQENG
jgi:hypothetical protein